jgi:hypothetical protein
MAEDINVKVCMIFEESHCTSRWGRKLIYSRLKEGPPKPKIRNPENFAPKFRNGR